jgi:Phosphodiester glycosidase
MRRVLTGLAMAAVFAAAIPAAAATEPSWTARATTKLSGDGRIVRYRDVTIPGQARTYHLVTVTWPLGDPRFHIRTALPGGAPLAGGWLRRNGLARWAKTSMPAGLVAAISPDYGSYKPSRAHTSGLLVRNGVLLHMPTGVVRPPSVGYTVDDRMVFGTPRAVPLRFQLAGGDITVGAVEATSTDDGMVGLYRRPGETVIVPTGFAAWTLDADPAAAAVVEHSTIRTQSAPVVYTLHEPTAQRQTLEVGFRRVTTRRVAVPSGGAVLVVRTGGTAAQAFAAAGAAGQVGVSQTDAAWRTARWVMGGKPLLVSGGAPVTEKPMTMTNYQWTALTARAAVGRTAGGRGVLAVVTTGNREQQGTTAVGFAALLARIGVTDAVGLDGGPVPEVYSPRLRSATCAPIPARFCYRATGPEFPVPAATIVTYTP